MRSFATWLGSEPCHHSCHLAAFALCFLCFVFFGGNFWFLCFSWVSVFFRIALGFCCFPWVFDGFGSACPWICCSEFHGSSTKANRAQRTSQKDTAWDFLGFVLAFGTLLARWVLLDFAVPSELVPPYLTYQDSLLEFLCLAPTTFFEFLTSFFQLVLAACTTLR